MDRTYLQEAFKSMQLLEEENFKLDDINLKDIKDFIMNDEEDELVTVFDDGAETEDELEETYIGKVILECEVCHSPIFKDVDDVHVDEETDLANIDDECPICHSQDGFKIVGEVAPFQEDPELKVEVEDKPECEDGECDEFDDDFEECDGMCTFDREYDEEDDDVSDIFGESLNEKVCKKCGKDVEEPCIEEAKEVCPDCGKEICKCDKPLKEEVENVELEEGNFVKSAVNNIKGNIYDRQAKRAERKGDFTKAHSKEDARNKAYYQADLANDNIKATDNYNRATDQAENKFDLKLAEFDYKIAKQFAQARNEQQINSIAKSLASKYKSQESHINYMAKDAKWYLANSKSVEDYRNRYLNQVENDYRNNPAVKKDMENNPFNQGHNQYESYQPLEEGFEKVDLEMEDKIIHVSEEQKEPIPDAEMITPVSDELEAELTAPETEEEMPVEEAPVEEVPEEPIEAEGEEMPAEDEFIEEPLEDEDMPLETEDEFDGQESLHEELDPELEDKLDELKDEIDELEDKIDDVAENICPECETDEIDAEYDDKEAEDEDTEAEKEDEVDFDVEDFDEDTFDELGESYLKSVYENVNSFKTTAVKACENRLTVEGLIKFNSGKEKQTQFIFEAADATKSGKVRFIGENAQITRGKKAFTLAGKMNGTRFMAESLNYNYRAKDTEGKSTRLYGTLKVKA